MKRPPIPIPEHWFDWHVYVVRCADDTLYTGVTLNVQDRVAKHSAGTSGSKYVKPKKRRPVELVYHDGPMAKSRAYSEEHRIKHMSRANKIMMIEQHKKRYSYGKD
jgi:putative endonuclease